MFNVSFDRLMRITRLGALAVAALLVCTPAVFAQATGTSTVRGTVTDSSGGVLPGATVTVLNSGTKSVVTAVTDDRGVYQFLRLVPGTYRVRAQLAGFGTVTQPNIVVNADRKRLLQVMTNLLSNAAKFSPEGEAVDVTTEDRGNLVRIAVHDRGSGIPENFRTRIFGRFTQADSTTARQKGGTGLGLAISKRLVEMMQGHIGFESREGGGTTFWFELPRHDS